MGIASRLVRLFALLGLLISSGVVLSSLGQLETPSAGSAAGACAAGPALGLSPTAAAATGLWFAGLLMLLTTGGAAPEPLRMSFMTYVFLASAPAMGFCWHWLTNTAHGGWRSASCWGVAVATLGVFCVAAIAPGPPIKEGLRALKLSVRSPWTGGAVGVIGTALAGMLVLMFPLPTRAAPRSWPPSDPAAFTRWFLAQPRTELPVAKAGAAVLIVKFNDYQCPPCRESYMSYQPVLDRYRATTPGAVRLVELDFPLDATCNALVHSTIHPAACAAAGAVRLARDRGLEGPMKEWLFANQSSLSTDEVWRQAHLLGVLKTSEAPGTAWLDPVRDDIALAGHLGVRATPTFFVNGVRLPPVAPQLLVLAIEAELRQSH